MTPAKIDVSVLVPVLNEAAMVEESAGGMRAQQFEGEVEVIFLDGGSEDGTRPILEKLARRDDGIRVFDNPARHIPQALNIGLREARGEYVARMDAHTLYPPDYLAAGVARSSAGRRRLGERAADRVRGGRGVTRSRARAEHPARHRRGHVQVPGGPGDRGRHGVHRDLEPIDARAVPRLGRGLADQRGCRARRPSARGGRANRYYPKWRRDTFLGAA